jgi:two-component system chemotaxis response regulator CheB
MSVRVLVVDDSALMRHLVSRALAAAPEGIEVLGTAPDGRTALQAIRDLRPDVVTLDVEMPGLDGLATLRAIMAETPTPVVMFSSLTTAHAAVTLEALAAGAVDFVAKPAGGAASLDAVVRDLASKVAVAATVRVLGRRHPTPAAWAAGGGRAAGYGLAVIGCSTGGPQALRQLLPALPRDMPPLLVVQHMPPGFTAALAERLDRESALTVREAAEHDRPEPGVALVAPGGRHLILRRDGSLTCPAGPPEHGVCPAVDATLRSVVDARGGDVVVAILTGMGVDGTDGARRVRAAGGYVLCESEETCVVYGMPRSVQEAGLAQRQVPLHEMPGALVSAIREGRRGQR